MKKNIEKSDKSVSRSTSNGTRNIFKKFLLVLSLSFIILNVGVVFADEEIPEEEPIVEVEEIPEVSVEVTFVVETSDGNLYDQDIIVFSCEESLGSGIYTVSAYCAVLQSGIDNEWSWWGTDAFLSSIEEVSGYTSQDNEGNDVYHYWSWSSNGEVGMTGLNKYLLQEGDIILLEFIDPQSEVVEEVIEPDQEEEDDETPPTSPKVFSVSEAISFLSLNQNENGSFSDGIYTDWVAIAVAKAGSEGELIKTRIYDYLIEQEINSSIITDYERRAMALMSLGINPYSGTSINYIKKITNSFDGAQIGDSSIYNDDIFGLVVLANAGYTSSENIIQVVVDFVISKQNGDGSWSSIDITAAAIQALKNFEDIEGSTSAISKGLTYLSISQDEDGGYGNSFSTSWASQALSFTLQASETLDYLANQQQDDGGVDEISNLIDNRVWSTSYAIPAVLSLSWNDILDSFSKPIVVTSSGGGSYMPNPGSPKELPPSTPLPEEKPLVSSDLMAVIETIPQEELLEIITEEKKPIKKIILKKENLIEVVKIDDADSTTKNLLQASAATPQPVEALPAWKIITLIAGVLWIVIGGFVLKFKI